MPVGLRLVGMSDPQQRRLRERSPHELERDRQPGSGKARGHGQSGEAQIVERPREARERSDDCESLRAAPQIGRSEEHTSELQSLMRISYAVFCLNKTTQ